MLALLCCVVPILPRSGSSSRSRFCRRSLVGCAHPDRKTTQKQEKVRSAINRRRRQLALRLVGLNKWRPKTPRRGDNHYDNNNRPSGSFLVDGAKHTHRHVYVSWTGPPPRQAPPSTAMPLAHIERAARNSVAADDVQGRSGWRNGRKRHRLLSFSILIALCGGTLLHQISGPATRPLAAAAASTEQLRPCNPLLTRVVNSLDLPPKSKRLDPYAAERVGDADNPGPSACVADHHDVDHWIEERERLQSADEDSDHDYPPIDDSSSEDEAYERQQLCESSDSESDAEAKRCTALPAAPANAAKKATGAAGGSKSSGNVTGMFSSWDWNLDWAQRSIWEGAEAVGNCSFSRRHTLDGNQRKLRRQAKLSDGALQPPCGEFTAATAHRGSFDNYTFKAGDKGVGYYAEARAAPAAVDGTSSPSDDLPSTTLPAVEESEGGRRRTRRARNKQGKRLKKNTRLLRLAAAVCGPVFAATGLLGDTWWREAGLWALDSSNANCYDTACNNILSKSAADLLLLQETRLKTAESIEAAKRRARKAGWNAHLTEAKTTEAGKGSGGCGVLARKGTGVAPADSDLVAEDVKHRISAAFVNAVVPGGFHVISVYLKDSDGLSEYNLRVLQEAAALALTLGGPWVMAGDWNVGPDQLQEANWLKVAKGKVFATELSTCNNATYDYCVVSNCLCHAVAGVQRLDDAHTQPHFPVRLLLRGDARRHAIRKLTRAPKVPATLPQGPPPKPPTYASVLGAGATRKGIAAAMDTWYQLARKEWAALTGTKLSYKRHRFTWECAVGAKSRDTTTALAGGWREAARRAEDILRLERVTKECRGKAQQEALDAHGKAITNIQHNLPAGVPPPLKDDLGRWAERFASTRATSAERTMRQLIGLADNKGKKFEAMARHERMRSWRDAIGATSKNGTPTRLAYRWLKGLTGWTRSPLGDEKRNEDVPAEPDADEDADAGEGIRQGCTFRGSSEVQRFNGSARLTPLCDQAVVEQEADAWGKLWCEGQAYPHLDWSGIEELPALLPEALRAAAGSFPPETGLGVDNIAPRALLRLSDESLEALAALLTQIEKLGYWPPALDMVLIVLLAKADGGFRPIGLFPTVIRVWMRARTCQARAWEAANASKELYGGVGMGAQRAAWVEAFSAEAAVLQQEEHAQALLDLTKAFEMVDHQKLLAAARKRGYPLAILRLSLAAYRLSRSVGIDGGYSRPVTAARGITAGSGFATAELKLLLLDVLEETHNAWGSKVRLTLYVDDLTISVRGAAKEVKRRLASAIDLVVGIFQDQLSMQVSVTKSSVIASTLKLARKITRASRTKKVKVARQAKLLGTGAGGGRRRSTVVIKKRLQDARTYAGRMWALRKAGVNTHQMTRAKTTAGVMYGADVQGIADSLLKAQTSTVARMAAPEGGGKNPTKTLYVLDGASGTLDPAFDAHALLVKHWAAAWWDDWVCKKALRATFCNVRDKFSSGNESWQKVAGPMAALWVSAKRAGWSWTDDHTMLDDLGVSWDALRDPPIAMMHAMRRTVKRMRFAAVAEMHPGLVPARADVGSGISDKGYVVVEFANVLHPLASGKVTTLADTPEWCRKHAASLLSAVTGGQWPQTRRASAKKWNITDTRCQLCFLADGTVDHRLVCRYTKPDGGWSQLPEKAKLAFGRIGERRRQILRTTGLLAIKLPTPSRNEFDTFKWGSAPFDHSREDVRWFIDGSMLSPRWRGLSTLGFAIAAVGSNGDLLAWGWGTPPEWCDSASAAEAWALCVVLQVSLVPPKVVTDCLGLVHTAGKGTRAACTSKMHLARVWGHIANQLEGSIEKLVGDKMLVWMPAHQTASCVGNRTKSDGTLITSLEWRANRLVDGLAKLAASDGATPASTATLLGSAEALVRHSAAVLGAATHNANNYQEEYVSDGGTTRHRTRRDAQQPERNTKGKELKPLASLQASAPRCGVDTDDSTDSQSSSCSRPLTRAERKRAATRTARKARRELEQSALHRVLQASNTSGASASAELSVRKALAEGLLGAAGADESTAAASQKSTRREAPQRSTAEAELHAAALAGTTTPMWNMLVAVYELAKPFLVVQTSKEQPAAPPSSSASACLLPTEAARTLAAAPATPPFDGWNSFLELELPVAAPCSNSATLVASLTNQPPGLCGLDPSVVAASSVHLAAKTSGSGSSALDQPKPRASVPTPPGFEDSANAHGITRMSQRHTRLTCAQCAVCRSVCVCAPVYVAPACSPVCTVLPSAVPARRCRSRPPRGSDRHSTASTAAAVAALVGPTVAKAPSGSTNGQSIT